MGVGCQSHPPAALPPVLIVHEAGWDICMNAENLAPSGIWSPNRPARSETLYRLRHPAHVTSCKRTSEQKLLKLNIVLLHNSTKGLCTRISGGGMFQSVRDRTRGPKTGLICSFPTLRAYVLWGTKSLPFRGHLQQTRKVGTECKANHSHSLKFRMRGTIPRFPHTSLWTGNGTRGKIYQSSPYETSCCIMTI